MNDVKVRFEFKVLLFIIGIGLGLLLMNFAITYLFPFILALLVAILIEPLVGLFEKKLRMKRGWAVGLALLLVLVVFILFLVAGVSRIYVEIERLSSNLPDYTALWEKYKWIFTEKSEMMQHFLDRWKIGPGQQEAVNRILQNIYSSVTLTLKAFVSQMLGFLAKLPSVITVFMISIIATYFISRDRRKLGEMFYKVFPKNWQKKLRLVKDELTVAVVGFIRAEMILISITTIVAIIGLEIMNSDYALILGFLSGALDLVPVVGPSLIFIPWAIYSMVTGNFGYGIGLLVIYGIMGITRQIAEVKLIGQSIGVHPLAALISMYVAVSLFGVGGFALGPAAVILLKALFKAGIITIAATKKE